MLRLAAAIGALRLRPVAAVLAAFLGAVYALLSMSALPQLTAPVPKLLLCAAASLPLVSAPRDLPRALLSLLAAACLTGGLMMALCLLLGGSLSGGALIGTVPLRVALLGAAAAALLPRPVAGLFQRGARPQPPRAPAHRARRQDAGADRAGRQRQPAHRAAQRQAGRHRIARAHAADGARPARALCGAVRRRHALRGAAAPCAGVLRRLARRGRARRAGRRAGVRRTGHHRQRAAAEGKER